MLGLKQVLPTLPCFTALQALAEGAPGLRCLSLRRCGGLCSVAALARLTQLEDLDLSYCAHASVAAVRSVHAVRQCALCASARPCRAGGRGLVRPTGLPCCLRGVSLLVCALWEWRLHPWPRLACSAGTHDQPLPTSSLPLRRRSWRAAAACCAGCACTAVRAWGTRCAGSCPWWKSWWWPSLP